MSKDRKWSDYVIPVPLSAYVDTMEDWELVEYASRYEATNVYCRNGATEAKIKEVKRVWYERYPGEEIMILECVSPLEYSCYTNIDEIISSDCEDDD